MTDRKHALLSASGAVRWTACPPSARWEDELPDSSSEFAKEGTLAHEYLELMLRHKVAGTLEMGDAAKAHSAIEDRERETISGEMAAAVREVCEYVQGMQIGFPEAPFVGIETRVDFSHIAPEGFGTADVILIGSGILHVIDFKYGKGVPVDATNNLQMALYALGALKKYELLYRIETVRMTIHQPRLDSVSTWELPVEDLLQLGEWFKPRAQLAFEGKGKFTPGDHCRFCRARQMCKARADENVKLAFGDTPAAREITLAEIGDYLEKGRQVAAWLADLEAYALSESLAGKQVPGWKAVEGQGSRQWTDEVQAFQRLMESGVDEAMLYERKAITLAASEKLIGKKAFGEVVGDLVQRHPGKPTLVPASDKRPAVTNQTSAAEAFGEKQ